MNHYTNYTTMYGITLLDELHNFFPALLYDTNRFLNVQDVLHYIREVALSRTNPFQRGLDAYTGFQARTALQSPQGRTSGQRQATRPQFVTETYEFTMPPPLFQEAQGLYSTQEANPISMLLPTTTNATTTAASAATASLPSRTESLLTALLGLNALGSALEPVIVRPTAAQLQAGTTLRQATSEDESESCSICQDSYTEGHAIRTIRHCSHAFHKTCVDNWFQRNVHCPICRHDVRQSS